MNPIQGHNKIPDKKLLPTTEIGGFEKQATNQLSWRKSLASYQLWLIKMILSLSQMSRYVKFAVKQRQTKLPGLI